MTTMTSRDSARAAVIARAEAEAQGASHVVLMEFGLSDSAQQKLGASPLVLPVPVDRLSDRARVLAERLTLPAIGPQPDHNLLYIRARTPVQVYGRMEHEVRPYRWRRYYPEDTPLSYFEGAARQIDEWDFDPV